MHDEAELAAHHKAMNELAAQHITPALRTVFRDHTGQIPPGAQGKGLSEWGMETGHTVELYPPYPKSRIVPEDADAHLDQWRASIHHPGNNHDIDPGDDDYGTDLSMPHYEPLGSDASKVPGRLTSYLSSKRGMGLMRDLQAGEYTGNPRDYE